MPPTESARRNTSKTFITMKIKIEVYAEEVNISSRCNCMDVQMKIESEDVKDLLEQIDEGLIIEYLRNKGYKVEEEE